VGWERIRVVITVGAIPALIAEAVKEKK